MENNTNDKKQISTPTAIIVAGFLVMVGILVSKGVSTTPAVAKTLSEQVGVSKDKMSACIQGTDLDALRTSVDKSVDAAIAKEDQGTPYSVVIGPNGFMTAIRGADSYENVKLIIDGARESKIAQVSSKDLTKIYNRNIALSEPTDHIQGSNSPVVTIIEYSDLECPYCKQFHPVLERIVKENPDVKWIYRSFPLSIHQHSFEKLVAANCVAKLKGDDAFFKYANLLFVILKTSEDNTDSAQL